MARTKATRLRLRSAAKPRVMPRSVSQAVIPQGDRSREVGPFENPAGGAKERFVVVTLTIAETGVVPFGVTEVGETVQVVSWGRVGVSPGTMTSPQVRAIASLNPVTGATVTV